VQGIGHSCLRQTTIRFFTEVWRGPKFRQYFGAALTRMQASIQPTVFLHFLFYASGLTLASPLWSGMGSGCAVQVACLVRIYCRRV
jgi:hypothetical protein